MTLFNTPSVFPSKFRKPSHLYPTRFSNFSYIKPTHKLNKCRDFNQRNLFQNEFVNQTEKEIESISSFKIVVKLKLL